MMQSPGAPTRVGKQPETLPFADTRTVLFYFKESEAPISVSMLTPDHQFHPPVSLASLRFHWRPFAGSCQTPFVEMECSNSVLCQIVRERRHRAAPKQRAIRRLPSEYWLVSGP